MKTIIVPVFDTFIARNIFRTDVVKILKERGFRVVILPPKGKADYYEKEFGGDGVIIEKDPCWKHDRLEFIFTGLYLHSIPTKFMRIRQVDWYWHKKKYLHYFGASILRMLGHVLTWRKFLMLCNNLEPIPEHVKHIFDKWNPDAVFAPTMIPREEVALMRLAKAKGKVTIGMFKSWDNPTSKAFIRIAPDWIICHNEIMVEEAVSLYDYPREKMFISGIPQYDEYIKPDFLEPRDSFFKNLGLSGKEKLILYAPAGDWMNENDKETLSILLESLDKGELPHAKVLLRLHPAYKSGTEELKGHPLLVVERPGKHVDDNLKNVEFEEEEMRHLASSLAYCDVLINTASTLSIEAAIYDKPVILLGFDGNKKLDYWKSVIRYYDREHYVPIVKSGGARLVKSKSEFISAMREYLEHPETDRANRARMVKEECFVLDGKAGERIGKFIAEKVK